MGVFLGVFLGVLSGVISIKYLYNNTLYQICGARKRTIFVDNLSAISPSENLRILIQASTG